MRVMATAVKLGSRFVAPCAAIPLFLLGQGRSPQDRGRYGILRFPMGEAEMALPRAWSFLEFGSHRTVAGQHPDDQPDPDP